MDVSSIDPLVTPPARSTRWLTGEGNGILPATSSTQTIRPPQRAIDRLFPRDSCAVNGCQCADADSAGGTSPQTRFRDRIGELQVVLDLLGRGMTDAAKRDWLEAPNAALGWQRPIDRLAEGDFDAVRGAAESYVVGDYV